MRLLASDVVFVYFFKHSLTRASVVLVMCRLIVVTLALYLMECLKNTLLVVRDRLLSDICRRVQFSPTVNGNIYLQ